MRVCHKVAKLRLRDMLRKSVIQLILLHQKESVEVIWASA